MAISLYGWSWRKSSSLSRKSNASVIRKQTGSGLARISSKNDGKTPVIGARLREPEKGGKLHCCAYRPAPRSQTLPSACEAVPRGQWVTRQSLVTRENQPLCRPAACSATTLFASVVPCSKPAVVPPRDLFGHHAACQRGAMFKTSRRAAPRPVRPPRCLPAWSHVQNQPLCRPATRSATTLNTAPRWRAAWWRRTRHRPTCEVRLRQTCDWLGRRPSSANSCPIKRVFWSSATLCQAVQRAIARTA